MSSSWFASSSSLTCRDGRKLRGEAKPKSQMAIGRFLSRGGGFFSSGPESSLADLGLQSLIPSHFSRTVHGHSVLPSLTAAFETGPLPTSSIAICARHTASSPRCLVAALDMQADHFHALDVSTRGPCITGAAQSLSTLRRKSEGQNGRNFSATERLASKAHDRMMHNSGVDGRSRSGTGHGHDCTAETVGAVT